MKRLLVLVLVAALAVGLYAATAGGGQQAVTPKQFAALKKQVTLMQKDVNTLKQVAAVLVICLDSATPTTTSPAMHIPASGEPIDLYLLGTTKECADAINAPATLKLLKLQHVH